MRTNRNQKHARPLNILMIIRPVICR